MDESFFFYHEDTDYSMRFSRKGYKLGVCMDSIIYHKKNLNTIGESEIGQKYSSINKMVLINKHFTGISWFYARIHHIFYPLTKNIYHKKFKLAFIHFLVVIGWSK